MGKMIMIMGLLIACSLSGIACPIGNYGACKADIGSGINTRIYDKVLPNNLDKNIRPNNTFDNRTQLGQPHTPSNINMEPARVETTKPYDANCQFGNCLNKTQAGSNKNK